MIAVFLLVVTGLSALSFAMMRSIEGAQSPEGWPGLPVWLLAVWSPSLAAFGLSAWNGQLGALLTRAVQVQSVPPIVWLAIAAPLVLVLALGSADAGADREPMPGSSMLAAMVAINLAMGPLGEEFGWRGWLTPHLEAQVHWLAAAAVVAAFWFAWHLPLWTVDSPQRAIPVRLFGLHVVAYAFAIAAAQTLSNGSLFPAIALHLTINLAANLALFTMGPDPAEWFRRSLPYYGALAALLCAWALFRPTA